MPVTVEAGQSIEIPLIIETFTAGRPYGQQITFYVAAHNQLITHFEYVGGTVQQYDDD